MKPDRFNPGHATVAVVLVAMAGCNPSPTSGLPQILLFDGTGTSPNGVAAIEKILKDRSLDYAKANSEQLNGLTPSQLSAYRLLIVPGGNYLTIGNSLTTNATANVHNAVQNGLITWASAQEAFWPEMLSATT